MSKYKIQYQPFLGKRLGDPGTQKITIDLNEENLAGLLLMSSQIILSSKISIEGIPILVEKYIGKGDLRYNAKFKNLWVQFDSLEFIRGAIFICNLLGKPWQDLIYDSEIKLTSNIYLGKILIFGDEDMIDIRQLPQYGVNLITTNSLIRDLLDCFNNFPTFHLSSHIYLASTDSNNHNVVATTSVTRKFYGGYLIYNACTYSPYKRQGLMKSILIMLINELLELDLENKICLEVDPNNRAAYTLYVSLGFRKIGEGIDNIGRFFHLMQFA